MREPSSLNKSWYDIVWMVFLNKSRRNKDAIGWYYQCNSVSRVEITVLCKTRFLMRLHGKIRILSVFILAIFPWKDWDADIIVILTEEAHQSIMFWNTLIYSAYRDTITSIAYITLKKYYLIKKIWYFY